MQRRVQLVAAAAAVALFATALATPALAQDSGFYSEHFEIMPAQGVNLLNLGASETTGFLLPTLGVTFQYIDDPLQLVSGGSGDVLSRVIHTQIRADLWASIGLTRFLDLGVALPLILNQTGDDLAVFARPGQALDGFAMGDLRLVPKLRLINAADAGGFGLALLANLSLPTGSQEEFTSDGALRAEPRLVLDWTDADSGLSVAANIGYHMRPKLKVHNLVIDDAVTWGLGVRVPTPAEELKLLGSVFGELPIEDNRDPVTLKPTSDGRSTPVELDLAAELTLGDFIANLGGGAGLTDGFGSPDFRLFLSVGYVPRCVDNDGDGFCNRNDGPGGKCKDDPEDFDGFEDGDGCSDPDNDGDGVLDTSDGPVDGTGYGKCRNEPEDVDGFEDGDGCPDRDNDRDGIPDGRDGADDPAFPGFGLCRGLDADAPDFRNSAEDKDGYQDADGCPELDNDGDGILDLNDGNKDATGFGACRDQPEDKDGFEDSDGCPDPDNDRDGEPDVTDGPAIDRGFPGFGICRDAPGLSAAELKKAGHAPPWIWKDAKKPYPGCPMVIADCECGQIIITQKVQFRYAKASLSPDSYPLLDEVARVLKEKKCASKIRVEGHTDWHGSDASNDRLSQRRVDSVVRYLVKRGVARGRLEAKGFGERLPLDPKDPSKVCHRCAEGCTCEPGTKRYPDPNEAETRRLNRRVQFEILELTDQHTGTIEKCRVQY